MQDTVLQPSGVASIKVYIPLRVVGVGRRADFHMSADVRALGVAQVQHLRCAEGVLVLSAENPMVAPHSFKILLTHPMSALMGVSAPGPAP